MATALALPLEPAESARVAGLRYVDPHALPGLHRARRGQAFAYFDARAQRLRDPATLERIRKLAIPPAWTAVWICPVANGHIQAIGRDARDRKQYRYHARWREQRDATKYHKMLAFADALPRIRAACERDLALSGLPRRKVIATAVRLLELTHVRIGHEEYTRENGSYGLTTLRDWHVRVDGSEITFHFRGKGGKVHRVGVRDRRLARIIATCSDLPGHALFQYVDEDATLHSIDSADVNEYIHTAAGEAFTAKDFRTWAGTVIAARTLWEDAVRESCAARGGTKKNVAKCITKVAAMLGNTPAICKRCYVHPAVIDAYLDGTLRKIPLRGGNEALVRAVISRASQRIAGGSLRHQLQTSLAAMDRSLRVVKCKNGAPGISALLHEPRRAKESPMPAKKSGRRKYGKAATDKVAKAMHERKQGALRSGNSGKKVTSRKQAIAIGLSEARRSGAKVPKKRSSPRGKK